MRAAILLSVVLASACSPRDDMPDSGRRPPVDVFAAAANAIPGGAWLSVWVPQSAAVQPGRNGAFDQSAYFTAGYAGVPALPTGTTRARLIGYDRAGTFRTLCESTFLLNAVAGANGFVYAAGENGHVRRYDASNAQCSDIGDAGARFTGIAVNDTGEEIFLVGETDAQHGVIFRLNGEALVPETLPATVPALNAITFSAAAGFVAVGASGTIVRRGLQATAWSVDAGFGDSTRTLRAVSSESAGPNRWTMVGGGTDAAGLFGYSELMPRWDVRDATAISGPIYGLFMATANEVYVVGNAGQTAVYNGGGFYLQPMPRVTTADLRGVHGSGGLTFAVGGTLSDTTPSQTGAVLVRGQTYERYTIDGMSFVATGNVRLDFSGGPGSQL